MITYRQVDVRMKNKMALLYRILTSCFIRVQGFVLVRQTCLGITVIMHYAVQLLKQLGFPGLHINVTPDGKDFDTCSLVYY